MPFNWPQFEHPMLTTLSACAMYNSDAPTKPHLPGKDSSRVMARYKAGKEHLELWLAVEEHEDDSAHIHIDVGRKDELAWLDSALNYKHTKQADLREVFENINGIELSVRASGEFDVPIDALPKRGIATTLLGLNTEANGIDMRVSGVDMAIHDDLYKSVNFRVKDESTYGITIRLKSEATFSDDYLTTFETLLVQGLEWFVFETTGKRADAKKPLPKQHKRIHRA